MKRALLALFAAVVCSCNAPATGLFVVVDVSPLFRNDLNMRSLELNVYSEGNTTPQSRVFANPQFPLSFSVLPARLDGTYRIEVKGRSAGLLGAPLFVVQRIVTMVEGEVRAISIPVRGHCVGSGVTRCTAVDETCLIERDGCAPARQPTHPYAQAVDTPCTPQIRDENFGCMSMPAMP